MTARNHHYLSQCYLKGFTKGFSKKSKLSVIDIENRKYFETIPRNVGGVRDFNRIEVPGVDPNILEGQLAELETVADAAINNLRKSLNMSAENCEAILSLIAFIAVRSPERREHMRQFHEQVAERVMDIVHHSKDMWEAQVKKVKQSDPDFAENVTYEQAKEFFEQKQYKIEVARERHIHIEMVQVNAILPCLISRKWLLLKANEESGCFITSDSPVCLSWKNPEEIPLFYRERPGYGLKGTEVYFPVSQNLALIGEFDGKEGAAVASKELIAALNTMILRNTNKQIYAPKLDFMFYGHNNEILTGRDLRRGLGA